MPWEQSVLWCTPVYLAWPGFHAQVPLPLDTDTGSHDQLPPRGEAQCRLIVDVLKNEACEVTYRFAPTVAFSCTWARVQDKRPSQSNTGFL